MKNFNDEFNQINRFEVCSKRKGMWSKFSDIEKKNNNNN